MLRIYNLNRGVLEAFRGAESAKMTQMKKPRDIGILTKILILPRNLSHHCNLKMGDLG